ncbi:MAG TPA: hypothetical protein VMY35_09890 [Phycisphaerae bacterium]|nr:hypothetical protein [Phycisphaerae bacterium]
MSTHAEQMVARFQDLLLANAGVTSVSIDGVSVTYGELERRLAYWERKVGIALGTRPRVSRPRLDNAF